jgi:hypothetical protein
MSALAPLTDAELKKFAGDWYLKLDVHAPMIEVLPMLATDGLEMKFPEATLKGLADFESWYQGVIRIFFDEVHNVKEVKSTINGDKADVKVVVGWEASVWKPPAAKSARIILDAYQTWAVKRSAATGKPVITRYTVDELKYAPNSAKL